MKEKEAVKNEVERRDTRFERRLKARKQELLDTMVNLFFTDRSGVEDPEGDEADAIFVKYRDMWIAECKSFNRFKRRPFTLRGEAFNEQVEKILEMERVNKKKLDEAGKVKDFRHWMRREAGWKHMFFRALWYYIKSRGHAKEMEQLWKNYYIRTNGCG